MSKDSLIRAFQRCSPGSPSATRPPGRDGRNADAVWSSRAGCVLCLRGELGGPARTADLVAFFPAGQGRI